MEQNINILAVKSLGYKKRRFEQNKKQFHMLNCNTGIMGCQNPKPSDDKQIRDFGLFMHSRWGRGTPNVIFLTIKYSNLNVKSWSIQLRQPLLIVPTSSIWYKLYFLNCLFEVPCSARYILLLVNIMILYSYLPQLFWV